MTQFRIEYSARLPDGAQSILVPCGLATPHAICTFRAATFHSMGLDLPELGLSLVAVAEGAVRPFAAPEIRLRHPAIPGAPA